MRKWEKLPDDMRCETVREYYEILSKKKFQLFLKRCFDIFFSAVLIVILLPVLVIIGAWIKFDSQGPVLFRQERISRYGEKFTIYKFRTMVVEAEKLGTQVTTKEDDRITRVGKKIRRIRLDELPQLFNILLGDMTFVGTRPEVEKYVNEYTDEMKATLLLRAGVTSLASIAYKDEDALLEKATDVERVYIQSILPQKMKYNLQSIQEFSCVNDLKVIVKTLIAVIK